FVEKEFWRTQNVGIYQQEAQIQSQLSDAEATLKQLCFFPADGKLVTEDRFDRLLIDSDVDSTSSEVLLAPDRERIRLYREQVQLQKFAKLPSIRLGYMGQSIDGISLFNIATLGVDIPFFDRSVKKQIEQTKISE